MWLSRCPFSCSWSAQKLDTFETGIKTLDEIVGGVNAEAGEAAFWYSEMAGFTTRVLKGCAGTELAKLFETTYGAGMIACFQEMYRISKHLGADFDDVVDFLEDTHRVRLDRPLVFPDVIGGHCLIKNIELLLKNYDSEFLRLILESNEKRKEEMKREDIRREVEGVRKRVEASERLIGTHK